MLKKLFYPLLILFLLPSCVKDTPDISGIKIKDIEIKRYEQDLFAINPENISRDLQELSDEYQLFIGENYRDTLNIIQIYQYINDPFLKELYIASEQKYPDLHFLEKDLNRAFKFNKYYFPESTAPDVYTYISGVDTDFPVSVLDSSLIIGIDCFLGTDFVLYKQMRIPLYRAKRMRSEYIKKEALESYARSRFYPEIPGDKLIDLMIEEGKIIYYLDMVLPEIQDTIKIGYTGKQLEWCNENDSNLWAFLMENELLFSSDLQNINKLVQDGPFTSYFSNESPARIGHWIGWQIVRSYMDNNNASLKELMESHDNQSILNKSSYKP